MYKITGAVLLLLLATMLTAENWMEIGFQTFSKPENDVTSYDITHWTDEVEIGDTNFDSICVVAHSEKIDDSTSALVFSRWFFKNAFTGNTAENYVLQDTLLLESGTIIDQVKFPISTFWGYGKKNRYEFDYIYFSLTKNNKTDICRVKHLGSNHFTQHETVIDNANNSSSFSVNQDLFLYSSNGKIFLNNLQTRSLVVVDSGDCLNPNILKYSDTYIVWEKVFSDTVKTFYAIYNSTNQTLGEITQFHTGDIRNLHISNEYTIWESGTGSNRKTYYTIYNPLSSANIHETPGNIFNLQTVSWYGKYCTYQIDSSNSSIIYLNSFFDNSSVFPTYSIESIDDAKNSNLTIVARLVVWAYAPWTYLKRVDGKYQLQSKMLSLPECGIEENSNNPQNAILIENYPNPFNNSTRVKFLLPQNGMTTISVYNSSGQFVKNLKREMLSAGIHNLEFKADELNSGLYFVRIENSGLQKVHKILLTK